MTGTDLCVNKCKQSRSYLNHLVLLDYIRLCGPGNSVGIATGYGLDSPGIESRWGREFPNLSRLGPTQPPIQWVSCLSRW